MFISTNTYKQRNACAWMKKPTNDDQNYIEHNETTRPLMYNLVRVRVRDKPTKGKHVNVWSMGVKQRVEDGCELTCTIWV